MVSGERDEIGLGSFPLVSLAEAREAALDNKRLIRAGGDPLANSKKQRITFEGALEQYLPIKKAELKPGKHRDQWANSIETYAYKRLQKKDVQSIATSDVFSVLQPIWTTKTDTAAKLRPKIEAILDWATVSEFREGENPARWKGNLDKFLSKPSKIQNKEHRPALNWQEAQDWWQHLCSREGDSKFALQLLVLTATRCIETRGALWSEFDFERKLWTIPANRMKGNKVHIIPVSDGALQVLDQIPRRKDESMVFPGLKKGEYISENTMNKAMKAMHEEYRSRMHVQGLDVQGYVDKENGNIAVPHGLRSTFRDWAFERGHNTVLAELALAHKVGSETERAYRRSDLLEARRSLMDDWGYFLSRGKTGKRMDMQVLNPVLGGMLS